MVRSQVQLTEKQVEALKAVAAREGTSLSELVRRGVDLVLRSSRALPRAEVRRRAALLAGKFASGRTDVSRNHDRHLAEVFRK